MAVIAALLLAYAYALAPVTTSGGGATAAPSDAPTEAGPGTVLSVGVDGPPFPLAADLFPPAGKAFIGVMTDKGPYDFAPVDRFAAAARRAPQVMLFGVGWESGTFDRSLFDRVRDRGMLPMVGWEPWDYRVDQAARKRTKLTVRQIDRIRATQPTYRLSRITGGEFDSYLRSWAEGVKSLGYPVAIRFAHEMNGDWYPWGDKANGNRPGEYVEAWRHVHDLFERAGATNVIWVWSPNARWSITTGNLDQFYPGDDYVDWVGATGYYGTGAWSRYSSFDAIFGPTIAEIRTFSRRPLVITETGASNAGGRKAQWIRETFQALPKHRDIIGLIWFEVDKEMDWRIVSSRAASTAFAQSVAAPRYDVRWSPDLVPRTELDG
ncbi:beta-mannanase [Micromonospora terminaliae]|uniref:Beta-mannanase n=2 Tax=Micromonospora terminaliae TaxID=1914461 RepID=A0AAJ3DHZ4_9ACTN|nr:glycosyl hydrolase [Micromonospora terminaliae]NES27184.1 beta-mannanase [Micromonospora terminaliae]QGL51386.1 beta-mannanase [Micromonospora terminaliae]